MGDIISKGVESLGRNPLLELIFTDFMGMTGPRTAIEFAERGSDAGRETLIREVPGAVVPVFFAGWMGSLLLRMTLMQQLAGLFNPHKIYTRAWVNAGTLEQLGKTFQQVLEKSTSPADVRKAFVEQVLRGLTASDAHVPMFATKAFKENASAYSLLQKVFSGNKAQGKLSDEAVHTLARYFSHHQNPWEGVLNLDEEALKRTKASLGGSNTLSLETWQSTFAKHRFAASQEAFRLEKPLLEKIERLAIEGGLSDQVLLENGSSRKLRHVLQDLKHFLEQYGDRALFEPTLHRFFGGSHPTGLHRGFDKTRILNRLFGENEGLIRFTFKSKRWLVVASLAISTAAAAVVAYINNWITQQKHGGKVFFPGEEIFKDAQAMTSLRDEMNYRLKLTPAKQFNVLMAENAVHPWMPDAPHAKNRFGNALAGSIAGGFLRALDFHQLGQSILSHSMIVYGLQNVARGTAASNRSRNEVSEVALRDSMGFAFWFFATPLTQRLFIRLFAPKAVKELLLSKTPKPAGSFAKKLWWSLNPVVRWRLASPAQMMNRLSQVLNEIKNQVDGKTPKEVEKTITRYFVQAKNWRNYAQALGILITILLLGIGIPLFNIFMTRQKVQEGKVGHY